MGKLKEFGSFAAGTVVDEQDWGGRYPAIIRPRRTASGVVVGVYPGAPDVVKIQTVAGETLVVRLR